MQANDPQSKKRLTAHIIVSLTLTLAIFALLHHVEAFEWLYHTTRHYEHYELDEAFLLLMALLPGTLAFAVLRLSESHRLHAQISQLAFFDTLTQLPNRAQSLAKLEQTHTQAQRHKHCFAVLFVDFDHFKEINDTYGHATGDSFLCQIGERLSSAIRGRDFLGRLGGDEFILIIHDADNTEHLKHIIARLYQTLEQPIQVHGHSLSASMSIGVACYPQHANNAADLLRTADRAMYRAKAAGKNQATYAS